MTDDALKALIEEIDLIFLAIAFLILIIEIVEMLAKGEFRRKTLFEMGASLSTQIPSVLVESVLLTTGYTLYWIIAEAAIGWSIPLTWWGLAAALLVADFIYYWEHRIAHEVRLLWTQHAVHHSSRDMNIVTAVRFGPLEGIWAMIVHIPMILMGFAPEVVIGGQIVVLAYQTWLHTELIGKLGPLERVLNTPSHHRVHHGCDDKYLDRNYAGVLIIWDRMFGTFQEEEETPRYGLKRDFDSQSPLVVWFSELPDLYRNLRDARSLREVRMYLFGPPGWAPKE